MFNLLAPLTTNDAVGLVGLLAQAPAAAPGGVSAMLGQFGLPIAIFAVVYFLVIRPQQNEQKQHQALLASLQQGDAVISATGLHGTIHEVQAEVVVLEIARGVRVPVDRSAIKRRSGGDAPAKG
jgi:preprotein translocase subunit YajC